MNHEKPEWIKFPGTQCLQNWALELKVALLNGTSQDDWLVVGHGAILEHANEQRALKIFRSVAAEAGLRFVSIPMDSVLDMPQKLIASMSAQLPALVYLEPGAWMKSTGEDGDAKRLSPTVASSFSTSHLLNFAMTMLAKNSLGKD